MRRCTEWYRTSWCFPVTSTRSPDRRSEPVRGGPADRTRRRDVDRRQRRRTRHRGGLLPPSQPDSPHRSCSATAVVQPGVILDDLQRAAAPHGSGSGPDPSTHSRCTIGGMIGNNACGSRALGYGRTADNVVELEVVTGTGELLRAANSADHGSSPAIRVAPVVSSRLALIRTEFGRFSRQGSGYSLEHLLPESGFDGRRHSSAPREPGRPRKATVRLVRTPTVIHCWYWAIPTCRPRRTPCPPLGVSTGRAGGPGRAHRQRGSQPQGRVGGAGATRR